MLINVRNKNNSTTNRVIFISVALKTFTLKILLSFSPVLALNRFIDFRAGILGALSVSEKFELFPFVPIALFSTFCLSSVFGKLQEDLYDVQAETMYQPLKSKEQSEKKMRENISISLAFASWPDAWRKGSRESAALHPPDLHKVYESRSSICSLAHPSAFVCCPFGWAVMIAIAGALSPCFQRDEIWRSPFVLYIDNNPLGSENHKSP